MGPATIDLSKRPEGVDDMTVQDRARDGLGQGVRDAPLNSFQPLRSVER
jgi:hypothetical protein